MGSVSRPKWRTISITRVYRLVPLPPPAPMAARSFISVVSATFQPLFTSPSRWSSRTRTSVKNTSLKLAPPVIWRNGRTSTPGARMSTMKPVRPLCLGRSGSVRAMISPMSLNCAPVVHTFWPVMIHSSPSRTALVCRLARSLPAPGSLNSWHPTSSARYIRCRYRSFATSLPWARMVGATIPRPMVNAPWLGTWYCASRPFQRRS